jgi:ribosomal protein S18 acetylase RimI-like enzyme
VSTDCRIEVATVRDAGEILTLQRAAYQSEALLYHDPGLPPLIQTLEELRRELCEVTCLKAVAGHRLVGSVRGRIEADTCRIGRLIVAPDLQGRGIGSRLVGELERRLGAQVARFEVFTGDRSHRNISLYRRLGYREIQRRPLSEIADLVFMEKSASDLVTPADH